MIKDNRYFISNFLLSMKTVINLPEEQDQSKGEIILFNPNTSVKLEVIIEKDTVWLSQEQIAELFGTKRPAITKHLSNIFTI
jgi:hypothetical protein